MSDHRRTKVQLIEELRALRARVAELERAEEALTTSEATLRSIHQAAPVGIGLVVGAERVLDWANERLARMTGYTREELKGMPARALYESREEYERVGRVKHADVRATGVGSVETRWQRKDGTVFDLLLSSAQLTDDLETGLVFTALDVTERKRSEDLLRRERDFSATVLDTVGSLVTVLDAEGRIVMFNRACREAGGFDFGEVKDRPFWEIFLPAEDRLPAQEIFEGMKNSEGATSFVGPLMTKDRQKRIVAWNNTTLHRSDGSVRYVICAGTDITERRRTERELRRLATAIEHAAEEIIITDDQGSIEYVNPAFERLTGYSRQEVVGRNPRLLKSGRQDRRFYEGMWRTITSGRVWRGRLTNRRRDGRLIEQEGTISPLVDASDRITGFVSVMRDVTEHLRLEGQLIQAQKMEAIGRLAGGVAHDFNNVLAVIVAYGELLREALAPGDPLRDDVEQISQAGQRGAALTSQLLTFSRRQVLEPKVVDLGAVVRHVEKMLRRLIGEDIDLVIALDPNLGTVYFDSGQMEQVILNLAVNARDAMPTGGALTIETQNVDLEATDPGRPPGLSPGRYVMLAVTDSGVGMDPDTMSRIFEPFFSTKADGQGTGLGLATVFGIVRQSGGGIVVDSEPGRGTVFRVYLPRTDATLARRERPRQTDELPRGTETILLLEDETPVRQAAARILRKYGYTILEAQNAGEGLMISENHPGPIHLLLTDVVLPKISGVQFAERLAGIRPETKVLYMSGYTDEAVFHHGVPAEGVNFIAKPFTPRSLARKVAQVLSAPS